MPTTVNAIVVTFVVLLILLVAVFTMSFVARRLRHLRNEQRSHEERQRLRNHALSTEEERQRSRQRLLHRAVDRIVDRGAACEGVALATEARGTEVLADRPMQRRRTRIPNSPGRPMVQLENGTAATVAEFVAGVRANGPPPDALPAPTVLQMLHDIQQQERERQNSGGAQNTRVTDALWEELRQLDEDEEREAEEKREAEREAIPDADEVYGKGLPYVLNPANAEIVYILDNPGENQEENQEERDYQRHQERQSSIISLDWILTPLLKRKSTVSFDGPGRTVD
ncbi:uncharacterized protein TM35_000261980 [Trypanosoma theileri]|uniref:Uncharacterized protein n=1 Tax=Trypanosoma theileri TaxID=67003 RepID=A0A1X0NPV4_9TRYP|nr:uncharacterized protein TM35_000261980 [Trypanosoma theileri]ORC86746.1 hypothetical protein TM35_000261980 [Trypanosoma theileri]